MQDPRWSQLKLRLVDQGWVWRDDSLHAPHDTMWFTTSSDEPDVAMFGDRMTVAHGPGEIDQAGLHEDLVSLVAALDAVLAN
jgi:hypothetical protein